MRKLLIAMLCVFALSGNAQTSVTINASNRLQTVEGWGVSLCWWAAQAGRWDDETIAQIADWLVSPDGLNYNVFRYNIPGGDDPNNAHCTLHHMQSGKGLRAEMKGFLPNKDNWNYDWSADEAQIKMLRAIVARAKHYGKENILKIEAFSNSCPWWMTVSGCVSGSDRVSSGEQKTNLKAEYYDDFARYLVDVCKHFKEVEGIEFYTLEPFNEPYANNYWTRGVEYQESLFKKKMGGQQEGCFVKPADQINFVKNYLAPELANASLNTVISVSDETNLETSGKVWDLYAKDADVMSKITQWNTHTYDGTDAQRTSLCDKVKNSGKRLWMSETGDMSSGASEWTLCKKLFDDVRNLQPAVWCDWQVMEPHPLWSTIQCGGSNNEFDSKNYWRNLNYYIRKQVTSYIKVGYTILYTNSDNVLAAISPSEDEVVVCVLNNSYTPVNYGLNLSSWGKSSVRVKSATITDYSRRNAYYSATSVSNIIVPKQSIVTLVLEEGEQEQTVSMTDSDGERLELGGKYMMSTTIKDGTKYPDIIFYASGNSVTSQKGWDNLGTGSFVDDKYVWVLSQVEDNQIALSNRISDNYLAGNVPDVSGNTLSSAVKFLPHGPSKIKSLNNIENFWTLEAETENENKYLNWNGNTVGNGFCLWKEGSSNNGSNFRFHRVEQATIRHIYVEKDGERSLALELSYKVNGNASLVFAEPHEFYHTSGSNKMEGAFTSIVPAEVLEGYVGNRYIVNGVEQDAMFKPEYIKHSDVVDVVFVCQGEERTEPDMTEFVQLKVGDKYLRATSGGLNTGKDDKYSIFLMEKREDGSRHLLSYGEGLYMNMASVANVEQDGNKVVFIQTGAEEKNAVKSGLDYLVVENDKVVSQSVMPEGMFDVVSVSELPVSLKEFNGKGYSTFFAPVAVEVPEGLEAYTANMDGDVIHLTMVADNIIPAATAVLLYTESDEMDYSLNIVETSSSGISDLEGTYPRKYAAGNIYGLNAKNGRVGFYKMKDKAVLSPFRAYLDLGNDNEAKELGFDFSETDLINAIEMWHADNAIYDLQGRKVQNPRTGVYVVNGRKVLIRR